MSQTSIIRHAMDARRLLAGDWGILFSNPEDFEEGGFERDRWIVLLHEAFAANHVVPLVLGPCADDARVTWVWAIDPRVCHVRPSFEPAELSDAVTPLDRGVLPAAFVRSWTGGTRFVALIAPQGRSVHACSYAQGRRPCAAFDLLAAVSRLKRAATAAAPGSSPRPTRRLVRA